MKFSRSRFFTLFHTFLIIGLIFSPLFALAQERNEIKGYVKDTDGNPIEGVTITRKGNDKAVLTDAKGFFVFKFGKEKENITLVFSHIGFTTKVQKLKTGEDIQVVLERAVQNNEDVMVIGYGNVKRKDLTGSISSFKPKKADGQLFSSVDNLLRGRAAGVYVQQSSGDPGGAVSVKIRGINSLRGDNEPLYVVDGVIVSNVTLDNVDPFSAKTANSGQTRQSGLAGINPQDIENIEILKDASATAIYGSRGSNGVVIITTKQGKGKPVIMFSSIVEFARASKRLPMLDAYGYASYVNEIQSVNGFQPKFGLDTLQDVNWQKELEKTGVTSNNRLSITGSSSDNKTKYFLAAGFLNNEGIVKRSGFKQGDIKLNLSQDLSSRIKMNFNLSGLYLKNSMAQSTEPLGGGDNSMITRMLVGVPIKNSILANSDPSDPYDSPLSWLKGYDDFSEEKRILAGIGFSYKISKTFTYKLNLATDYKTKERKRWFGNETFVGKNANGSLGLSQLDRKFYQIENLLLYNKKLAKQHQIDGTIGVTYDNENISSSSVINENFFSQDLRTDGFGFGQLLYPYLRNRTGAEVFSVLARLNYNFKEKYLLTLSGRTDGSSKFAKGNKFSYFPSVAAAWRISEEKFLKPIKAISELKLRVGYGKSGNQAVNPYGTFARYGQSYYVNGNTLVSGAIPLNIQNNRLKWETTSQFNAGIDASLLNNRIALTVDGYYKKTKDLLQVFTLPGSTGFQTILKNIGTVENKGIEFNLNGLIISKKNLTLNAGLNMSFNRNKILDLGLPTAPFGTYNWEGYIGPNVSTGTYFKSPANIFIVGQPIGMFYGYKTNGVYQLTDDITNITQFGLPVQHGDLKIVDQDGNGDINPDDKVLLGNPNPKFVYGFTLGGTYKNISMDLFFNGSYGNKVANGNLTRIGNANGINSGNILADYYYDAWTPEKGGELPRVGYDNLSFIDKYVEDASFMRLSTATVSYTFDLKKKGFIKSLAVSLSGKNLFTITNYSGFDPEVNSFSFDQGKIGVDWGSYPNLRAYVIGVNMSF